MPRFVPDLEADSVRRLIGTTALEGVVLRRVGKCEEVRRLSRRNQVFRVSGPLGDLILRFPRDEEALAVLRREETVQRHWRKLVRLQLPDTVVLDGSPDLPVLAVHSPVLGDPLETSDYWSSSPGAREGLADDLAAFFAATHAVPLSEALGWLGREPREADSLADLALRLGKPAWFGAALGKEMDGRLAPRLDEPGRQILHDTGDRFVSLPTLPESLVFGHGDMHGFNMAVAHTPAGVRLVGVFDLENAGIMDLHEDFFRLNLVSEDLLAGVLERYQELRPAAVDRGRIELYYRAFLLYLMDEQVQAGDDERLAGYSDMLSKHVRGDWR